MKRKTKKYCQIQGQKSQIFFHTQTEIHSTCSRALYGPATCNSDSFQMAVKLLQEVGATKPFTYARWWLLSQLKIFLFFFDYTSKNHSSQS